MLELVELRKRFGEIVALDGLSFSVREAQMFGFVGPNGAGTPLVVPARAARDALAGWELAASIVLTLVGTLALMLAAARIYRRAVLRLGAPLKLREAFGLLR